ncbi:MAG: hypothetical protein NT166_10845 [Candidatus Aminicenantes bacterium]|nr:hypothetical protein [Candidatus Aminicenantes bacterium]
MSSFKCFVGIGAACWRHTTIFNFKTTHGFSNCLLPLDFFPQAPRLHLSSRPQRTQEPTNAMHFHLFGGKEPQTPLHFHFLAVKTPNAALHFHFFATEDTNVPLHFQLFAPKNANVTVHFHLFAVRNTNAALLCDFSALKSQPASCFFDFPVPKNYLYHFLDEPVRPKKEKTRFMT